MFGRAKKNSTMIKRVWAAVAFAGALVVNGFAASTTLIGGTDTAAVSDGVPNLFAPAGVTFAIWGVIYLLVAAYVVYQLWFVGKRGTEVKSEMIDAITPLFTATSLINIAWIFAWQYKVFWLSALLIVALLIALGRIVSLQYDKRFSLVERVVVKAPFSVYFGWVTVATIANITTALVNGGWAALDIAAASWTVAMLVIAAVIGIVTMLRFTDCLYGLVFVWAFSGILIKHLSDTGWAGDYQVVVGALMSLITILALVSLTVLWIVVMKLRKGERQTAIDWHAVKKTAGLR